MIQYEDERSEPPAQPPPPRRKPARKREAAILEMLKTVFALAIGGGFLVGGVLLAWQGETIALMLLGGREKVMMTGLFVDGRVLERARMLILALQGGGLSAAVVGLIVLIATVVKSLR